MNSAQNFIPKTLLILILPLLVLIKSFIVLKNNCLNWMDIGIYHQALVNMFHNDWNPFITLRGLNIFNDHFDPIVIVGAVIVQLFGSQIEATLVLEWVLLISFVFLIRNLKKHWLPAEWILFLFLFCFSRGMLTALDYPAHASVWSFSLWGLFVWWCLEKAWIPLLLTAFAVCLFKESYPYLIVSTGCYFLFKKQARMAGCCLIGIGAFFIFTTRILRPVLVGTYNDYGSKLLSGMWENPGPYFLTKILNLELASTFKQLAPLFLLLLVCFILSNKEKRNNYWLLFFILGPLFFLQFLWGSFTFHYCFPFYACSLTFIAHQDGFKNLLQSKKILTLVVLLFSITSFSFYTKALTAILFPHKMKCHINSTNRIATQDIIKQLEPLNKTITYAATGGIATQLIRPERLLFPIPIHANSPKYIDYIILERNGFGDTYPIATQQIEHIVNNCSPYAKNVFKNDSYFYVANGPFPSECLTVK